MLTITIPGAELFNEETQEFINLEPVTLELEHSLLSLSKWESRFEKAFLGKVEKSPEETLGYIYDMIISPKVDPDIIFRFTQAHVDMVSAYIESKQSATTIYTPPETNPRKSETITAELIYYWMFSAQIPLECERWHLNKLLTLIRVFGVKNGKPKKMSKQSAAQQRHQLNEERKARLGTTG